MSQLSGMQAATAALPRRGPLAPLAWLAADPRRMVLALYLISLTVNLLFGFGVKYRMSPDALEMDEQEYYTLASQILHGMPHWDARRTLAYPLFVAGIRSIADSILLVQVVLTACFSLSAPLLALLARRISGSALAGAAAGLLLAVWPPSAFYGTSLYSESLALPFFLASLLALPPGSRLAGSGALPRLGWALGCGALLGLTTHIRPMYLLFTPFLCVIVAVEERRIAVLARRLVAIGLGYALVILPWSAAMTAHFGHPILVTSNGGETLAGGLNPVLARGLRTPVDAKVGRQVWTGPGKWVTIDTTGYLSRREQALPYDRMDALLRARTRDWIRTHPADTLRLEASKLAYMWGIYPIYAGDLRQTLFGNLPTIVAMLIGIATLAVWPASRVRLVRFWMLPLFVSAVALISWGSWRFRQPGDAGLLAMIAIALVHAAFTRRTIRDERGTVRDEALLPR